LVDPSNQTNVRNFLFPLDTSTEPVKFAFIEKSRLYGLMLVMDVIANKLINAEQFLKFATFREYIKFRT
jgi:hypothetical protein